MFGLKLDLNLQKLVWASAFEVLASFNITALKTTWFNFNREHGY